MRQCDIGMQNMWSASSCLLVEIKIWIIIIKGVFFGQMFFSIIQTIHYKMLEDAFIPLFESGNHSPKQRWSRWGYPHLLTNSVIWFLIASPSRPHFYKTRYLHKFSLFFAVREAIAKRCGAERTFYIKYCQCLISQLFYNHTLSAASLILLIGFEQCRLQKRFQSEVCMIAQFFWILITP